MRVLIVEDEAPLRETLAARMQREGFAVDTACDGEEAIYMGREVPFDIVIVDLGLPRMSGIEVVKKLRELQKRYPILILTARSSWQDKVEGLKSGADDYLVKPFHIEELLARVNALVRRSAGWSKPVLECGPVAMDTTAQTVAINGQVIDLTSYEYKVLEYLMLHAGELVSKSGDLMMYGSKTLVLFYETFSTSYSYTKIGQIDDTEDLTKALGTKNVTVTFE